MRTVNTFNKEYMYKTWLKEVESAEKPTQGAMARNIIFYGVLICIVIFAFFSNTDGSGAKRFGPFSYNTVLTTSMQSVYPQGSLILSWAVGQNEPLYAGLENGSDIVFVRDNDQVVVHRIVNIYENYDGSGQRAFNTQGVDNPSPDSWITFEGNVLGKVIFCVPYLGTILLLIGDNVLWIIGAIVLATLALTLWKVAFSKDSDEKTEPEEIANKEKSRKQKQKG